MLDFRLILAPGGATMSQKSSIPRGVKFVSRAMTSDTGAPLFPFLHLLSRFSNAGDPGLTVGDSHGWLGPQSTESDQ